MWQFYFIIAKSTLLYATVTFRTRRIKLKKKTSLGPRDSYSYYFRLASCILHFSTPSVPGLPARDERKLFIARPPLLSARRTQNIIRPRAMRRCRPSGDDNTGFDFGVFKSVVCRRQTTQRIIRIGRSSFRQRNFNHTPRSGRRFVYEQYVFYGLSLRALFRVFK